MSSDSHNQPDSNNNDDRSELPLHEKDWDRIADRLSLPPQEKRTVEFVLRGYQDIEIAEEMGLTISTVRNYLSRAYDSSQVKGRLNLVLKIFRMTKR